MYGRWNQYSVYQWEHWGQKLGLFTNTVRYHWIIWQLGGEITANGDRYQPGGDTLHPVGAGLLAASVRRLACGLAGGLAWLTWPCDDGRDLAVERPKAVRSGLFCLPVALALLSWRSPPADLRGAGGRQMVSVVYTWQYLHAGRSTELLQDRKRSLSRGRRQLFCC